MKNSLILSSTERNICTITINNPDNLNALNSTIIETFCKLLDQIADDDSILAVIITGAGRSFIAGADIEYMATMGPIEGRRFGMKGATLCNKIENLPQPVIAAVNGYALGGGCELALACDIRIASEKAKFGQPEVTLGIIPGFSGTIRLPSIIGLAKAKELIFTGRLVDSSEALEINLVNRVVPADKLMEETYSLAHQIVQNSPLAVRYSKESINLARNLSIEEGIKTENNYFALCFASNEQKEGMQAFLEKRRAKFINSK